MMNWTRTNGDGNGGITINTPNAGMTWAPEAYWDDDLNAYVVFFSSRMFTDDTHITPVKNDKTGNSSYAQVRYAITRDFVNFTEPQMWQDTGYCALIPPCVRSVATTTDSPRMSRAVPLAITSPLVRASSLSVPRC